MWSLGVGGSQVFLCGDEKSGLAPRRRMDPLPVAMLLGSVWLLEIIDVDLRLRVVGGKP